MNQPQLVTVRPLQGSASGAAAADLLLRQQAAGVERQQEAVRPAPELTITDLRKLTALLRPIFGLAAHVLVNRSAVPAADRETLIDGLAQELADPVLGDSFRIAARVALMQS
jgi:hypothetical protein